MRGGLTEFVGDELARERFVKRCTASNLVGDDLLLRMSARTYTQSVKVILGSQSVALHPVRDVRQETVLH